MNLKPLGLAGCWMVLQLGATSIDAQSWIASSAPTQAWTSVACSASGLNLVAVGHDGVIYISANSAVKWTRATGAPNQPWTSVACSADGTRIIAASDVGAIAVSTNSGAAWTMSDAPTNTWWAAVGVSAEGSRGVAAAVDGNLFISTDSGASWNPTSAPTNQWSSVASSTDGSRWIAGADPGPLYLSSDSGVSWNTSNVPILSWTAVASSSDGTKLAAAALLGGIYVSADSGSSWKLTIAPTNEAWISVASSADGTDLIAAGFTGGIYSSTNSGLTWTLNQAPGNAQYSVCLSADGSKPVAAAYDGGILIPGIPAQTQSNRVTVVAPKGVYQGLFFDTNGISAESSGSCNAAMNSRGAFSAKLGVASKFYSFTGRLPFAKSTTNSGPVGLVTTNTVLRRGLTALTVVLDFGAESNAVIGSVSDGNWNAKLEANRAYYSSTNSPVLPAADFTFLLPTSSNNPAVAGFGYGAVHISAGGRVGVKGSLADGNKFTQSAFLSGQNQWPWFSPLYGGRGLALAWLAVSQSTNAVDGDVEWIRPSQYGDGLYPAGFTNRMRPQSSVFQLTYSAPLVNFSTGLVSFVEGNLPGNFTNQFALRTNSIVRNLSGNSMNLRMLTLSGLFRGVVVDPHSGRKIPFAGAMLQEQNSGKGYFLGTDESGAVLVNPIP